VDDRPRDRCARDLHGLHLSYVLDLRQIDETDVAIAGGKGAQLGALSRIAGVHVPPGFVVTTAAFDATGEMPEDVAAAIAREVDAQTAYAVRSSATAEDLPTASFAGQHDSFLNIVGVAAILEHVRRCWASLYSGRATAYRERNGFEHEVRMAVVVQEMVHAEAAGVLFTADPISGNRKVARIEGSLGLGEALVAGKVNPAPVLTESQTARLTALGRRIEAHFGRPQDIEWCLVDDDFQIVQSRPITALFPIPAAADAANHVYISVGHQQMMTDAMKPLGLSLFQRTALRPMLDAGGRLFVDVTHDLASPAWRAMIGRSDPLIGDALQTVLDRGFLVSDTAAPPARPPLAPIETDPAIVTALLAKTEASLAILTVDIATKSGPALLDFILADLQELKRLLYDRASHQVIMAGMEAAWWLTDHLQTWLGEARAADTLTQSVPHNVTSEMGLALLQVADVIRPHAAVVAALAHVTDDHFLDALPALAGGREARVAIDAFLDNYGMRCAGEIDITRPRWRERPSTLVPILLHHIANFAPGTGEQRFARGLAEARAKEHDLLARLRSLPDGAAKADETKRMIDRVRSFAGYREFPKYGQIRRYFLYKQALLREAARLVAAGVLRDADDSFFLTFDELHEVTRTNRVDDALVRRRKDDFRAFEALTPPRVLTSDGEAITGAYHRTDIPAGALVGLPVSAGSIEGRARVILDIAHATLEPGDILVTTFTDPSWTPLFVAIAGLVTEVGGLMTHGAVIAREYGLPAIVGVEGATRLIRDGQRIRVDATTGYVELR
jgi:rifampicin phosphotransferase